MNELMNKNSLHSRKAVCHQKLTGKLQESQKQQETNPFQAH